MPKKGTFFLKKWSTNTSLEAFTIAGVNMPKFKHLGINRLDDYVVVSGTYGTPPATASRRVEYNGGKKVVKLEAVEGFPINFGFLGKGNSSMPEALNEQIEAGAIGLKLHEDWGTTPATIDCCLSVAENFDVQVAIHTDTLNESGFVEDSISAFKGRTIHTYHTEGAGGGQQEEQKQE